MKTHLANIIRLATAIILCAAVSACSQPISGGAGLPSTYVSSSVASTGASTPSIMDY